jgi:hypothetical protein
MEFPKPIQLFYVPTATDAEAHVVVLTEQLIRQRMGNNWWNDPAINPARAAKEIDRYWDWSKQKIAREDKIIASRKLAVITGDGAVQGAMMISAKAVPCQLDFGKPALFVELLFIAPSNRHWIRKDNAEQFRGVGVNLLRTAAQFSLEAGFAGRLKLESSPAFVDWYENRGLLETSKERIIHEDVMYTPMELPSHRVSILLPD